MAHVNDLKVFLGSDGKYRRLFKLKKTSNSTYLLCFEVADKTTWFDDSVVFYKVEADEIGKLLNLRMCKFNEIINEIKIDEELYVFSGETVLKT